MSEPTRPRSSALEPLRRFGRRHRRWLAQGMTATVAVVFFRLAMPWPLRGAIEAAFPGASRRGETLIAHLPAVGDPLIWLCAAYLAIAVGIGLAELAQRVGVVRFVAQTVQDLRGSALAAAARRFRGVPAADGDLIARLVGDTGRLKADLIGLLVHLSTDALLFLAVSALFLFVISPEMGAFFLLGGLAASWIGYRASAPLERVARRARHDEGVYAVSVQHTLERGDDSSVSPAEDDESTAKEAHSAHIVGQAALAVHIVLGLTVALAVLTGVNRIQAGLLAPGDLFLFIAYALMVHRRLVHAGRQLARLGKVRACLSRLSPMLEEPEPGVPAGSRRALRRQLEIVGLRLDATRGRRPRIETTDISISAGARVAVLGRVGDGKSSLLRCLAGVEPAAEGVMRWDGEVLAALDSSLSASVGYLPQEPLFAPGPVWRFLGLAGPDQPTLPDLEALRAVGVWDLVEHLPKGLRQRVGSAGLSRNEARSLSLGSVILRAPSLWVLDSPLEGLSRRASIERLHGIIDRAGESTVVVSMAHFHEEERFDRVILLRRGRIRFDGTPRAWQEWKRRGEDVVECKA